MRRLTATVLFLSVNIVLMGEEPPRTPAWPKEPSEVFGVSFGSSEDQVKTARNLHKKHGCMDLSNKTVRICMEPRSIDPFSKVMFSLEGDKLTSIYATFNSDRYTFVRDVFVEKYGAPTTREVSKVRTRAGVEYDNEILTWKGSVIALRVSTYGNNVNSGTAIFITNEAMAAAEAKEEVAKKKAAGVF